MIRRIALLAAVLTLPAFVGCGSDKPDPTVLRAGQVDIKLPPGWKVTERGVERPASAAPASDGSGAPAGPSGGGAVAASTGDTVPLAQDDPQTAFFKSVRVFQSCLKDNGTKFIGIPDPKNPSSPTNDPAYLKTLGTCAAKSNILQAMQKMQKAQDAMTPKQIEDFNKGYLKWRDCMIGKGWGIPKPKPDSKGRLFTIGPNGPGFTPPPGQDAISSPDFQACFDQVRK